MKNYVRQSIFCMVLLIVFASVISISCESFVNTEPPNSQLSGDTVFEDSATARAALGNCYALLCDKVMVTGGIEGISVKLGYYSDEIIPYSSEQSEQVFFQNNLTALNSDIETFWNDSYNVIYSLNAIIEGVEASKGISTRDKEILAGEALVTRSLIYFNLVNLFGEVPYVVTTNYKDNIQITKMSVSGLYQKLSEDLTIAHEKLPIEYKTSSRTTPNKSVAAALLARLYLYQENWALASDKASEVINNSALYNMEEDLPKVFLMQSRSTLWQLSPSIEGAPTREGQSFIFTEGPPPSRALNTEFVQAFELGDLRKDFWIGNVTNGQSIWYFPYKYKQYTSMESSAEYSILIRLEELYLIRAEARAMAGDIIGATDDLNLIRSRAGLQNTVASGSLEMRNEIINERRFEFFCEQGHRWFDLKRTGLANEILSLSKPGWTTTDLLWPLPQNELLLNPALLPQNPDY